MVVGITMVRDEADIIEWTVLHMLSQCDVVIVADNNSTDGTREKLEALLYLGNLHIRDDPETGYWQSRKMTTLAHEARDMGATWVVPFDADELWLSRDGRPLSCALEDLPESVLIAQADLWDHVATAEDPDEQNPVRRMGWRRPSPAPLPKVAVRPLPDLTIAQGNHSAMFAERDLPGVAMNLLTIRHFPYRSRAQVVRKVRNGAEAYAATTLPPDQGAHWRAWGQFSDEEIGDLFAKWHWRAEPGQWARIDSERQPPLVFDPAPYPVADHLDLPCPSAS